MDLTAWQALLGLGSGGLVGLVLGLIGGGGAILAVPLLVHAVGVPSAHVAIGTSAVAVALNALMGLAQHARAGHVRWPCALVFAAAGVAGAAAGAALGQRVDGQHLLAAFAVLMAVIALRMLLQRRGAGSSVSPRLSRTNAPRLLGFGAGVGTLSGFFGIGGGFLIVPALRAAAALPMIEAVGSSLVAVAAFGATAATSYAMAGLVDWRLVALFVAGGAAGSWAGARAGQALAGRRGLLERGFAVFLLGVAAFVFTRAW
jgi:uncharacterized protein